MIELHGAQFSSSNWKYCPISIMLLSIFVKMLVRNPHLVHKCTQTNIPTKKTNLHLDSVTKNNAQFFIVFKITNALIAIPKNSTI